MQKREKAEIDAKYEIAVMEGKEMAEMYSIKLVEMKQSKFER